MRILTVTGYKPQELGIFSSKHPGIDMIKKALRRQLLSLLDEGLEWVIISGQLGVELWTAEVAYELREEHPHLKVGVFTPFLEQEEKWNDANKEYYLHILSRADHVDSITKRKYESPQQFRAKNIFLIEKSNGLLAVYDEEKEGSPRFLVELAKQRQEQADYGCMLIRFSDLQLLAEEEQWSESHPE
ncbi:DUF1273 domain-containing protein [Ectobacillus ponti]|uniref:UPF0398 protein NK662_09625 n=1 Tax=Ectobacillus ponti TaxID=2961894 RepID=A0AA41X9J5_9BACI|nr:DUF1273 domain-containing protein [Ectobacillus ponti]MCP8968798.1 DUF1273 domain-containing protein [Ectobacillus ponti]